MDRGNRSYKHAAFLAKRISGNVWHVVVVSLQAPELLVSEHVGPDAEHFASLTAARLNGQLTEGAVNG